MIEQALQRVEVSLGLARLDVYDLSGALALYCVRRKVADDPDAVDGIG